MLQSAILSILVYQYRISNILLCELLIQKSEKTYGKCFKVIVESSIISRSFLKELVIENNQVTNLVL